jgi:hypothetical protein
MKSAFNLHHRIFALLFLFTLVSCAQNKTSSLTYKFYPGKTLQNSEVATLTFGERVDEFLVDGMKVKRTDFGSITLKPGVHEIEWKYRFAVSVLVNSTGWDEIEAATSIPLEAGHVYSINADRTTGRGYRMFLWISDETTGKQVFAKEI